MAQIQVIHSGTYHAWPEAPRVIVVSDALAEALDNLLEVADAGLGHVPLERALDRIRQLHDWRTVRLGGEQVPADAVADDAADENGEG